MQDIVLNPQQEEAKKLIKEWYDQVKYTEKQTFVLAGYAGTGKTFLIKHVIKDVLKIPEHKVAFITPTGKAASVLIQRGIEDAMTVHRLIYTAVEDKKRAIVDGQEVINKSVKFVKKREQLNLQYDLFVLDEVSMVDKKVMIDLLSYGVPVLCSGDIAQLPPICESNGLLEHPDYNLTEIVRQSADNEIVKLATLARKGIPILPGRYGNDAIVVDEGTLTEEQIDHLMMSADQILCGRNITRHRLNDRMKRLLGFESGKLSPGEKIICLVNNWEEYLDEDHTYNFVNGIIGTVETSKVLDDDLHIGEFSFRPDFLDEVSNNLIYDTQPFKDHTFSYDMHQRVYRMMDGTYKLKKFMSKKLPGENDKDYKRSIMESVMNARLSMCDEQINQIDNGWCISVHKSQGSEWEKVLIFDESGFFNEPEKHLYTAITRAKKKLVIIR